MKTLAPYLALAALGVASLDIKPPVFYEDHTISFNARRKTGIAAARRAAKKNRNRKKSR